MRSGTPTSQRHRAVQLAVAEVGAVGRAEVLDDPDAVLEADPGVPGAGVVVGRAPASSRWPGRCSTGAPVRPMRVPRSPPSVTTRWRRPAAAACGGGALRSRRRAGGGCAMRGCAAGAQVAAHRPACTPSTNSQSSARNPKRISCRASAEFIGADGSQAPRAGRPREPGRRTLRRRSLWRWAVTSAPAGTPAGCGRCGSRRRAAADGCRPRGRSPGAVGRARGRRRWRCCRRTARRGAGARPPGRAACRSASVPRPMTLLPWRSSKRSFVWSTTSAGVADAVARPAAAGGGCGYGCCGCRRLRRCVGGRRRLRRHRGCGGTAAGR